MIDFTKTDNKHIQNALRPPKSFFTECFKKYLKKDTKIKASGGIRSREDALKYIEAGCSRIGTSSGIKIMKG